MKRSIAVVVVLIMLTTLMIPQTIVSVSAEGTYNYGEALQKSIMFYEFQRSGKLPADKRMNWRGDSGLTDGADNSLDLTGGWYDAGDHVKFNLPMAYSATMLAWSVYEYRDAYVKSGQLPYILDNIKWVTDYLIKCHPSPNEYYYQVGDGSLDHAWWGPVEVMQMKRPSYKVDTSNPGSTVVAETAAALAAAAVIFKDTDPKYSETCLKHAKELFTFADTTRSDKGYTAAQGYYNSWSGYWDELTWACAWLNIATNDATYLSKVDTYEPNWEVELGTKTIKYKWGQCWDNKLFGALVLLEKITQKPLYKECVERNLDWWTKAGYQGSSVKYTPKGLAWLDMWGSLRYATTEAFVASVYADWSGCDSAKASAYKEFAKSQADYALGSAGRSFVVGFGTNPPKRPHHRTAHGSWYGSQDVPNYHRHTLYGALVGGPGNGDDYTDDIANYTNNEVACDYNAGFVGLLAATYGKYGGTPIANFKAMETPEDEYTIEAGINVTGTNFVQLKVSLSNKTGWPARVSDKLSYRYFVDLSEVIKAGFNASDVKASGNTTNGGKVESSLIPWDVSKNIYYVNVDFSGTKIYPGGINEYKRDVYFSINAPNNSSAWDNSNDFSFKGLTTGTIQTKNIPVYDNGVKVYGDEPGETSVTPTPTTTVVPTSTPTPTLIPTATPTTTHIAPTPSSTDNGGYDFKVDTTFSPARLVANQMMTAKVTATNVSAAPYEGKYDVLLIVALYDSNNTMMNVSYISKGIPYQGTETLSAGFKLPTNVTGYSVKAFMWDGQDLKTTNMLPLSNVTQIP